MKQLCIWVVLAASAATARAQDSLNPAHVLTDGEAFVEYGLRFNVVRSNHEDATGQRTHDLFRYDDMTLRGGIGIGNLFEVEASTRMIIGGLSPDVDASDDGWDDLRVDGNFRIGTTGSALHGLVGVIGVAPTGNEHNGIGQDTWQYGLQAAIVSNSFVGFRPYAAAEYVIAREHNLVGTTQFDVDPPDVSALRLGVEIPMQEGFTFDLRATLMMVGKEEFSVEGFGVVNEEDSHRRTGLEGRLYMNAGKGGTFILDMGFLETQRHDTGGGDELVRQMDYFVSISIFVPFDTRPPDIEKYGR